MSQSGGLGGARQEEKTEWMFEPDRGQESKGVKRAIENIEDEGNIYYLYPAPA